MNGYYAIEVSQSDVLEPSFVGFCGLVATYSTVERAAEIRQEQEEHCKSSVKLTYRVVRIEYVDESA